MIKLFAYQNKAGQKSIKIVGVTGDNGHYFGGISLGKVLLASSDSLDVVLEALKNYDVLSHLPKRGEGLPQFNESYKMFNHDSVYCQLGELDPNKLTVSDLEKTIRFLKGLDADSEEGLIQDIYEITSSSPAGYEDEAVLGRLPDVLVGVIAVAGTGSTSGTARKVIEVCKSNGTWTGSSSSRSEESEVVKNLRALARSLGYDIVKL